MTDAEFLRREAVRAVRERGKSVELAAMIYHQDAARLRHAVAVHCPTQGIAPGYRSYRPKGRKVATIPSRAVSSETADTVRRVAREQGVCIGTARARAGSLDWPAWRQRRAEREDRERLGKKNIVWVCWVEEVS